jgi:hypothetical protein
MTPSSYVSDHIAEQEVVVCHIATFWSFIVIEIAPCNSKYAHIEAVFETKTGKAIPLHT